MADVQLKLGVIFDQAVLRAQIAQATRIVNSEFTGRLNVRFNQQTLNAELNNLQQAIKRRSYRIEIGTNLEAEIRAADRLVAALGRVQQAARGTRGGLPIGTATLSRTQKQGGFTAAEIKTLFGAAIQGGLLDERTLGRTRAQMVAGLGSIGVDAMAGLLNGLNSKNADLKEAAQTIGATLIATTKSVLGIASPSKEFEDIGKSVGKGFEKGALSSMDDAFNALESKIRQRSKVLDTLARGIFRMLGMDPAFMLQQARQQRMPPAINWPATVASLPRPSIGPSSTGRALPAGRAAAGMIGGAASPFGLLPSISGRSQNQAIVEALIASTGPRMLPSGGGPLADVKRTQAALQKSLEDALRRMYTVLEVDVQTTGAGLRDGLKTFSYLVQALKDAEGRTKAARIADEVEALIRKVELMLRTASSRLNIRQVTVSSVSPARAALTGSRIAGALPPAVGRAPSMYSGGGETREQMFARRTAEAYARSSRRGLSVMSERQTALPGTRFMGDDFTRGGGMDRVRGVGQPPERGGALALGVRTPLSPDYYKNAFKYAEALKVAQASTKNFSASSLPFIGGLKRIGEEFGVAAKQVLLYGTAYKGLAFIMGLPGQILEAAKSQQQYTNSLKVVTEQTGTYQTELLYVDTIQRRFGLNLDATRKGFTDLYASMAPTGFDSGSIQKLFTGISAATAALQLTPATMDRVIYAFAQMASKGQVMSEELKRQLGDALPGALGIFANAAGMSIKDFNTAMEKGEFTGQRFRDIITQVTDELINRFSSGAEAAGRSLQGLINIVGGDFKRTLEAFTPLVNSVAQATLMPLGNILKQFSSAAQIAMGEMDRVQKQIKAQEQIVKDLKLVPDTDPEQIRKAEQALVALQARYDKLNIALQDPATKRQAEDIKKFVAELARLGTIVLNVASAIGSTLNPILTFLGTNLSTVTGIVIAAVASFNTFKLLALAAAGGLLAYNAVVTASSRKLALLQLAFKFLGLKISLAKLAAIKFGVVLKGLLIASGIGAVVVGLGILAAAFSNVGNSAKRAAEDAKNSLREIKEAAAAGDVVTIEMKVKRAQVDLEGLARAEQKVQSLAGARVNLRGGGSTQELDPSKMTPEQRAEFAALGIELPVKGVTTTAKVQSAIEQLRSSAQTQLRQAEIEMPLAQRRRAALGLEEPRLDKLTEDDADDKAKTKQRQIYISEMARLLAQEMEIQANQIRQDASLSDRQREIQEAAMRFRYENLINETEYNVAVSNQRKEDLVNRDLYLSELKKKFDNEQQLIQQRYEDVVTRPLRDMLDQDRQAIVKLTEENKIFATGQDELSHVQKRQIEIRSELNGLDDEALAKIKPLIDKVLEYAKAVDTLTEAQKALKAERGIVAAIEDLQAQSGLLSPLQLQRLQQQQSFRDQLRNLRESGASPEQLARVAAAQADIPVVGSIMERIRALRGELEDLRDVQEQVKFGAEAIGSSFAQSFKDAISGAATAQEALAAFFQRIGDSFLDMAARMIQKWMEMQIIGLAQSLLPGMGSIAGVAGGMSGGFSTGSAFSMAPSSIPAAGGITMPSFKPFARGGIVTGPTLGLIGEGRYNEAVVPLPDGKSIPVELGNGAGNQIVSNITVNVSNGQAQSDAGGGNSSELGRKLEGAVKQVIVGELRPGGLLSSRR